MPFYADDRILYRQIKILADTRILQNDLVVIKNGREHGKYIHNVDFALFSAIKEPPQPSQAGFWASLVPYYHFVL